MGLKDKLINEIGEIAKHRNIKISDLNMLEIESCLQKGKLISYNLNFEKNRDDLCLEGEYIFIQTKEGVGAISSYIELMKNE